MLSFYRGGFKALPGKALGPCSGRLSLGLGSAVIIQWPSVVLALSFAMAVGVFFGYYPAHRAAQLDPVDALRYE